MYVSLVTFRPTTFIGPMYFGMSFLACPLGMDKFLIDRLALPLVCMVCLPDPAFDYGVMCHC